MISCLPVCILFHKLLTIHSNIIGGVQNLSNYWKDYEFYIVLIWVVFEHVDRCHHSSLHGRRKDDLEVDRVDGGLAILALFNANWVKLGILTILISLDCTKLLGIFSEISFGNQGAIIEGGKAMPDHYIRTFLEFAVIHGWGFQLNVVLLHRVFR